LDSLPMSPPPISPLGLTRRTSSRKRSCHSGNRASR
jgi:hypothetical protein